MDFARPFLALSAICAITLVHPVTAQSQDAPTTTDSFECSVKLGVGKLKPLIAKAAAAAEGRKVAAGAPQYSYKIRDNNQATAQGICADLAGGAVAYSCGQQDFLNVLAGDTTSVDAPVPFKGGFSFTKISCTTEGKRKCRSKSLFKRSLSANCPFGATKDADQTAIDNILDDFRALTFTTAAE
jgi:hypothetical protein